MAEAAKLDGIFNLTQPVVMSFPQLFEPKAFKKNGRETGESKYSANFLFNPDSEDLRAMKILAAKIARAKWPDKQFSELAFPFISGDKLAEESKNKGKNSDYTRGKIIVTGRSKFEPKLAHIENNKMIDLETEIQKTAAKNKFYPGVEVLAQLNLVSYDPVGRDGKGGVTAYLNMVLSTNKGVRIAGGQTASEAFKGYAGSVSAEDPTAPGMGIDMSDHIPF